VIVRTLSEQVIAAKMASANTFHHEDMLSRLKLASRTSSMQWYTGFTLLAVWAHAGKPLMGKYVPEIKSSGVMSAD
jgi:hypothetical protein